MREIMHGPWKSSDETSKTVLLQDNIITSFAMKISLQEKKQFFDFCLKKLGIKRKSNGVVTDEEKSLFHQTIKT
jgi:hypothetical protein